jgi:hypothetical protein
LWKITSALILVYRPPFSGQRKLTEDPEPQDAAPGDTNVPKPSMASACWADDRAGKRDKAAKIAKKANFLKRNLL